MLAAGPEDHGIGPQSCSPRPGDRLFSPSVVDNRQLVIEQRDAIASRQTKPRRVRGDAFCDHPGVIEVLVENLSRDLSDAGRIDVVSQQVDRWAPSLGGGAHLIDGSGAGSAG